MNPFLERDDAWPDFHHRFIYEAPPPSSLRPQDEAWARQFVPAAP
jgi:hypothetical protein